jgi:DNA-binding NtrC family response regulator
VDNATLVVWTPEEYRLDVLIVAADDGYRSVLADLLRLHEYKIIGVRSAAEAVLVWQAGWTPKITIVDLAQMTREDWSKMGPLADEQQNHKIRLVFIAASMATPMTDASAALVLPKPVDFRTLLKVVESCCKGDVSQKRPSRPPSRTRRRGSLTPA